MFDKARADLAALLAGVRTYAPNLADEADAVEGVIGEALTAGKAATDWAQEAQFGQAAVAHEQDDRQAVGQKCGSPVLGALVALGEGGLEAVVAAQAAPLFGPAAPVIARVFVEAGAAGVAAALKAA